MRFELLTLAGTKFSGDASEVSLVTAGGAIGILPNHEPMTAVAVPGPVTVKLAGGREELFATFGGLLEVTAGGVRLLADEADHVDDLIGGEIQAALERARKLKTEAKDQVALAHAQEMIDREELRLGVARMRRTHHERSGPTTPQQ